MADTSARKLLSDVLEKVTTDPQEWSGRDTEKIACLRRAAEYEEAAEKVADCRNGR
ncbi:hypothetical protein ID875_21480 [Streptomyces globisporus]|uniref:Uncharacterized protein n=1 Tax=Streptomyces globisporus TaxID=1908 RepID=A0A927GNU0_STRGL|nr:hypothetical protein [Streptomyces globisporus]